MRAFRHARVDVTDEPTAVCVAGQAVSSVLVRNVGGVVVYLGGADVTVENGFPLKADDPPFAVPSVEYDVAALYAVTAKGRSSSIAFLVSS